MAPPPTEAQQPSPTGDELAPAVATSPPAPEPPADGALRSRWLDVVEDVQRRNTLLAAMVRSAQPVAIQDTVLTVAFSTEHNRKSAERSNSRQLIESAFERVYGTAYRLRAVVAEEGASLMEDPVINFAQRRFGGQPRRVPTE